MLIFSGPIFDSNLTYQHLRSLLMDFFRGNTVPEIDVEALQYVITISTGDPSNDILNPPVHLHVHLVKTLRSGQKLPRVELEEMGPRMDFKIGRVQEPIEEVLKEALKRSKEQEPKTKKNVTMDVVGDKIGRIHLGKQDIHKMQTRKMKGLRKWGRGGDSDDDMDKDAMTMADDDVATEVVSPKKMRTA